MEHQATESDLSQHPLLYAPANVEPKTEESDDPFYSLLLAQEQRWADGREEWLGWGERGKGYCFSACCSFLIRQSLPCN